MVGARMVDEWTVGAWVVDAWTTGVWTVGAWTVGVWRSESNFTEPVLSFRHGVP